MKVIWNPAVTLDGYIAQTDGSTDWITEEEGEACSALIRQCGCAIVGRTSYERDKAFFTQQENEKYFVWTTRPKSDTPERGVEFLSGSPKTILGAIAKQGFSTAVLAGGSQTNSAFAAAGLIDEVIANIYPLTFGEGIKLLDGDKSALKLKLVGASQLSEGIVRLRYTVVK